MSLDKCPKCDEWLVGCPDCQIWFCPICGAEEWELIMKEDDGEE